MGSITVTCDECQTQHCAQAQEFDFEEVDRAERAMGAEVTYEGSVEFDCECGNTIEVTHRYWEYPEGMENHKETEADGGKVVTSSL
jgi:hypothetical protein